MPEHLNVLITNANYRSEVVGGGQRSVQFLAEGLAERGHRVTVLSVAEAAGDETANGVRAIRLPIRNLYWPFDRREHGVITKAAWHALDSYNLPMASAVARVLDEVRPDLLHTNVMTGFSVAVWDRAAARGVPLIHTLRDYYVVCARSEMFRNGELCTSICARCRPFTLPRRLASRRVDAVVGNSRAILDTHLRNGAFGGTPVRRVIYNGYRPPESLPADEPRGPRLRVGFLGRLDVHKGIEHLLDAVKSLPDGTLDLLIAGGGQPNYERRLEERYASSSVRFMGFAAPQDLFKRIDLLVVPSLWPEPLPRTVFEAYAHGVPVVGSDRGGIPEVIDEGVTGHVFRPAVEGELAELLRSLATHPERVDALRPAARAKAAEFLPERVVDEYLDAYRAALAGKKESNA